jgi:hypothetical protein
MTDITINASKRGQTIATNGRIQALLYSKPPDIIRGPQYFTLIDDGVPGTVPRIIYNFDANNSPWAYPQQNSAIWQMLISESNIPFVNLTVQNIPNGAIFIATV